MQPTRKAGVRLGFLLMNEHLLNELVQSLPRSTEKGTPGECSRTSPNVEYLSSSQNTAQMQSALKYIEDRGHKLKCLEDPGR